MKVGWYFAPLQRVACPCKAEKGSCQESRRADEEVQWKGNWREMAEA